MLFYIISLTVLNETERLHLLAIHKNYTLFLAHCFFPLVGFFYPHFLQNSFLQPKKVLFFFKKNKYRLVLSILSARKNENQYRQRCAVKQKHKQQFMMKSVQHKKILLSATLDQLSIKLLQ